MIQLGVINVDASQNGHLLLKGHNTVCIVGPQILLALQMSRLDHEHCSLTCPLQLSMHMGATVGVHLWRSEHFEMAVASHSIDPIKS